MASKVTTINPLSEKDLVAAMVAGKEDAFTEIYNRYWERLLSIAFNLTRSQVQAEEVTQEVFISLWDRRGDVEIGSLGAYLATAVKFSVFKSIVRQRRRQEILKENYTTVLFDNTEDKIYTRFLKEYIDGVVETLPEKCRLVFQYSRREGLSVSEVAKRLDISPKTAEAHLTKALKVIRLSLKSSGPLMLFLAQYCQQ
jgi:RNA polymerase sigma-70 factor (family 1)